MYLLRILQMPITRLQENSFLYKTQGGIGRTLWSAKVVHQKAKSRHFGWPVVDLCLMASFPLYQIFKTKKRQVGEMSIKSQRKMTNC